MGGKPHACTLTESLTFQLSGGLRLTKQTQAGVCSPHFQCSYTAVPSCSWPAATSSAPSLVINGNRCCRNGLTTCLRSHPSSVAVSWKRWSDCSDAECHSGRGFSASWGSGEWCFTLQSSHTLHSFVFFSLGMELLFCYCSATTLWPGFSSPLVSSVWDCVPSWCWQHTHLSGFLYMCLFQHFTVLTSWTWDGRI